MDKILILDFGGQTTQLIGRRIRDFGVYSEIAPGDAALSGLLNNEVKGIILSGSPYSSWEEGSPQPDPAIWNCGIPVLGICYGFHALSIADGGEVVPLPHREYGRSQVFHNSTSELFHGIPGSFASWMSHGDSVRRVGKNFTQIATSENGVSAAAVHNSKLIFGVQFHPEASHCEFGVQLLENFACRICSAAKEWSLERYIEQETELLREKANGRDVLLLISGGVDSTVAAAMLLAALPHEKIWLMYIDTGMMRKGESEEVAGNLRALGAKNLLLIDAGRRFLTPLSGVVDPEKNAKSSEIVLSGFSRTKLPGI